MLPLILAFPVAFAVCSPEIIQTRLTNIAHTSGGTLGVAATLVESGDEIVSFHGDDHFPMQSVYKLPIAMAALELVDRGKLSLDQMVKVTKRDFVSAGQYSPVRDRHP